MWKTGVKDSEEKDSKVLYSLRKLNGVGSGGIERKDCLGLELPQLYPVF